MSEIIIDIETIPDLEYGKEHMNLNGHLDSCALSHIPGQESFRYRL